MNTYLSHWTALTLKNIPFLEGLFHHEVLSHADTTHHVTFKRSARYKNETDSVHLCTQDIPAYGLQTYREQACVSPEFAFTQVAYDLSIHRLILLGLIMCASPDGLRPVTTSERLATFVNSARGLRGRRKATRATRYIRDNSQSPMDAILFMLLCLPCQMGGFGFIEGELDYCIPLVRRDAEALGVSYIYPNLAFPQKKVLVEYSRAPQCATEEEQAYVALRDEILRAQGFTVISFEAQDLYCLDKLAQFIHRLSQALEKDIRIQAGSFLEGFIEIYSLITKHTSLERLEPFLEDLNVSIRRQFIPATALPGFAEFMASFNSETDTETKEELLHQQKLLNLISNQVFRISDLPDLMPQHLPFPIP